jgi:hypothetical protein
VWGRLVLFLLFAAAIATPVTAHAGRSSFGWLQDTEVIPERGAEITTFVSEENRNADEANARDSSWWVAPQIGITDQLALGLPVELQWAAADGVAGKTNFLNYGAELRYRMVTQDPVDKPDFAPLVRLALKRVVTGTRDVWQPELDVVGSYETGGVRAVLDLGLVGQLDAASHHFDARPGAGVSIRAIDDLRLGAEVFSEISLDDDAKWVALGPNVAWSHGRTWISAAYGIGLYHIRDAPKLNWGIAF